MERTDAEIEAELARRMETIELLDRFFEKEWQRWVTTDEPKWIADMQERIRLRSLELGHSRENEE